MEHLITVGPNSKLFNSTQTQLLLTSLYDTVRAAKTTSFAYKDADEFDFNAHSDVDRNNSGAYGTIPEELRSKVDDIYKEYIQSELTYRIHTRVIHLMQDLQRYQKEAFEPNSKKNTALKQFVNDEYRELLILIDEIENICRSITELGFFTMT